MMRYGKCTHQPRSICYADVKSTRPVSIPLSMAMHADSPLSADDGIGHNVDDVIVFKDGAADNTANAGCQILSAKAVRQGGGEGLQACKSRQVRIVSRVYTVWCARCCALSLHHTHLTAPHTLYLLLAAPYRAVRYDAVPQAVD